MKKTISAFLLLPLLWTSLPAQFGFLDSDFDGDGIRPVSFSANEEFKAVAVQPDGKIVALGSSTTGAETQFLVTRFLADGTLDLGFNGTGYRLIDFYGSADNENRGSDLLIQPDGKIVVAGTTFILGDDDMAVARLMPDGTLDNSFSTDGRTSFHMGVGSNNDECTALAMDADGNYYLGGTHNNNVDAYSFMVTKLGPTGLADPTWGIMGMDTFVVSNGGVMTDMILLQDGRILCGGWAGLFSGDRDFGLLLLKTNGDPDSTFSSDGRVHTNFGLMDRLQALAQQADGKILAGGEGGGGFVTDLALTRYSLSGSLDLTFDVDGKATYDLDNEGDVEAIHGIVMQPDGKILVAGTTAKSASAISFAGRYNADGSRDATFGTDGFTVTDASLFADGAFGLALQPDLRLVIAGLASGDAYVARYITGMVLSTPDPQGNAPLTLYPNPVQDKATLRCQLAQAGPVEVLLTDLAGRVLHTFSTDAHMAAGEHEFALHLPDGLAAGEYLVVMSTQQANHAVRLIKQ